MKTQHSTRIFSALSFVLAFYLAKYPNGFETIKIWLKNYDTLDILWYVFGVFSGILTVYLSNKFEVKLKP
ncbi:hypothetical protein VB776_20210 [Arcicella sp. DC2W]|uniref:Uncharacterized protein n=1 Tax=Arcicella gelida TaxID=2984195 RepID=A0ABU5S9W2_9BACT|nr:hypothetical protein [Arcicella sp. DC2W]MEA5405272.1 hypothetical protein [Arcicella sp. DC2W]